MGRRQINLLGWCRGKCSNSGRNKERIRLSRSFYRGRKGYPNWKALCIKCDEDGVLCKDIYGRDVFYMSERFPCFDSFDHANETRYYRWFFLKEKGKLTRVYYADERNIIQITEDVRNLEKNAWKRSRNWVGWNNNGWSDNMKFRSCMTRFAQVSEDDLFLGALEKFFEGQRDFVTLEILQRN